MSESRTEAHHVEHTLRVHASFDVPDLTGVVPGPADGLVATGITDVDRSSPVRMHSVYYDTDDLRLLRWGLTLCRCTDGTDGTDGPDEGWLLTLGDENRPHAGRHRTHLPLEAGPPGRVPRVLVQSVTALTGGSALAPVCSVDIERTVHLLRGPAGAVVARLADDVVIGTDQPAAATGIRELQVTAPDADALAPVLAVLRAHGAMRAVTSTPGHLLGPAAKAAADVAAPAEVHPEDPAGAAVQAHVQTYVRRLLHQDVRVRLDLPDSVHQMRVAARRLRSGLRVFSPLVERGWARHLRAELGWAASELGLSRDAEVLLARLDDHADELGAADARRIREHIDPPMRAKVAAGRAEVLRALGSQRHLALLEALVDAAAHPRLTKAASAPAADVMPPLFDKSFRQLAEQVAALTLDGPSADWHHTRIAAKRARYAADALVPVFGTPAKDLASALSEITEVLGEHQDAFIAQETTRELAEQFDGPTGLALGLLNAHEAECERRARLEMMEQWPLVQALHHRTRWG